MSFNWFRPLRAGKSLLRKAFSQSHSQPVTRLVLAQPTNLPQLREASLAYMRSMRVVRAGKFAGYRYSEFSNTPVLYSTVAALLLKHLLNAVDDEVRDELRVVQSLQCADGLFRDPAVACHEAEEEDWWGWRHLTVLALMSLSLYGGRASRVLPCVSHLLERDTFRSHLDRYDWGDGAAWTSNAVQNVGVMLQYARDYQGVDRAGKAMEFLFGYLDERQDAISGLYGSSFDTPEKLSNGVQAGYHFWLLYFYDRRPIQYVDKVIDSVLATQSLSGGYGVGWNSSACEDIDSVDPLVRLSCRTKYRKAEIQSSLDRGMTAILRNVNADGGWVFRRDEAFTYGFSRAMHSLPNESNTFFTWFRWLSVCLALKALPSASSLALRSDLECQLAVSPGYQFWNEQGS